MTLRFALPLLIPNNYSQIIDSNVLSITVVPHYKKINRYEITNSKIDKSIYNWNVTSFTGQEIKIMLNFTDPNSISPRIVRLFYLYLIV